MLKENRDVCKLERYVKWEKNNSSALGDMQVTRLEGPDLRLFMSSLA